MEAGDMNNDTRGWILCIVSGLACCFGATLICLDVPIRLLPHQKRFRIQDSNAFLACSLSLSFGVMLFSALYSMLPSAMRYLAKDEWDHQTAGFLMMGCFVGGFVGIQIISRVIHQYLPSHIVDCDHTHKEHIEDTRSDSRTRQSRMSRSRRRSMRTMSSRSTIIHHPHMTEVARHAAESTPLLPAEAESNGCAAHPEPHRHLASRTDAVPHLHSANIARAPAEDRRSSIQELSHFVKSVVKDKPRKSHCDESNSCYGYSEPCGQECDKLKAVSRNVTLVRSNTGTTLPRPISPTADGPEDHRDGSVSSTASPLYHGSHSHGREATGYTTESEALTHPTTISDEYIEEECVQMDEDAEAQHHHHVPENAFLSISLQTVIAIALHKFPEGFITYATNHASRSLGFNVFMALFVHNIAEGFSMALPLYLALGSRFKAIAWSSLLGGLSQPMGAAIAVLWFKLANRSEFGVDNTAYACLFGITAGIMTSVALQLFVESLSLNHNKNLSILFAFLGMSLMGFSNALVLE